MSNFSAFVGIIGTLFGIIVALLTIGEKRHLTKKALAIISTVLIVIIGAGVFFATSTTIIPHPPSNPFVSNATQTPTATPSPTSIPSPIPTPQVIQINQTMTIISPQAAASFFSLIVKTATIDPARMQMTLLIGLQNNGTSAVGEHLNYLRFQDQITGDTKDGAGEGFTDIDFAPGQTILFRPTFPFTPVAGRTYQLSAQLGDFYDFSPITIKF